MVVALEARIYWREVPHAFGLQPTCALAAFDHDSLALAKYFAGTTASYS